MPQVMFHIYVCTDILAGYCASSLSMAMAMGLMHNMWQDDIENRESEITGLASLSLSVL